MYMYIFVEITNPEIAASDVDVLKPHFTSQNGPAESLLKLQTTTEVIIAIFLP